MELFAVGFSHFAPSESLVNLTKFDKLVFFVWGGVVQLVFFVWGRLKDDVDRSCWSQKMWKHHWSFKAGVLIFWCSTQTTTYPSMAGNSDVSNSTDLFGISSICVVYWVFDRQWWRSIRKLDPAACEVYFWKILEVYVSLCDGPYSHSC